MQGGAGLKNSRAPETGLVPDHGPGRHKGPFMGSRVCRMDTWPFVGSWVCRMDTWPFVGSQVCRTGHVALRGITGL